MIESTQPPLKPAPPLTAKGAPADKAVVVRDSFQKDDNPNAGLMKLVSFRTDATVAGDIKRPMDSEEKPAFKEWFPALDVDKATVTWESDQTFNCISETTSNHKSWDWPPSMYPKLSGQDAFKKYYTSRGFSPISKEEAEKLVASGDTTKTVVAYWEDNGEPTHGSVHGPGHGFNGEGREWTSKCGQAPRIDHSLHELDSPTTPDHQGSYGIPVGYWLKTRDAGPAEDPTPTRETLALVKEKIQSRMATVDPQTKVQFAQAYAEWKAYRNQPEVARSSNPQSYCQGQGYDKLVSMGPAALPMLMDGLQHGDHFCQHAVKAITSTRTHDVRTTGGAELASQLEGCGEQARAGQVLEQYLKSNW